MAFDARLDPTLAQLARQPLTLDVLGLLASGAAGPRKLRTQLRARHRRVAAALRVLAAYGLISRPGRQGSWDVPVGRRATYVLTGRGHELARKLQEAETLVAIYELLLYGEPRDGSVRE